MSLRIDRHSSWAANRAGRKVILSGTEITRQVEAGAVTIFPFEPTRLNPNSYNYRLGNLIKEVHPQRSLGTQLLSGPAQTIPENGFRLNPGKVYLSTTHEVLGSDRFVTSLIGRSSIGRLGLFLQLSADLGNLGPAHRWTLELTCAQPIIIYPEMTIGQVIFWMPEGEISLYAGQYTNHSDPTDSLYDFGDGVS